MDRKVSIYAIVLFAQVLLSSLLSTGGRRQIIQKLNRAIRRLAAIPCSIRVTPLLLPLIEMFAHIEVEGGDEWPFQITRR
jgi:hypothetical protein